MTGLKWDPTIGPSTIITCLTFVLASAGSAGAAYIAVASAIANHEYRLMRIEEEVSTALRPSVLVTNSLTSRMASAELAIERGRGERLEFQKNTAATNSQILEALSRIREDLAAVRATQKLAVHP